MSRRPFLLLLTDLPGLASDPLRVLRRWREQHGDVVTVPAPGRRVHVFFHPQDALHVLVGNPRNYLKGIADVGRENPLGEGLVSSNGPLHDRQRKVLQPAFRAPAIPGLPDVAARAASAAMSRWEAGRPVDITREMARVSLTCLGETLFRDPLTDVHDAVIDALLYSQRHIQKGAFTYLPRLLKVFREGKYRASLQVLRDAARRLLASGGPLADRLRAAHGPNGKPLPEKLLHDEVMTLLAAGHETVADALSWTWHLLARNPEPRRRLLAELDAAPAGADPAALPYAKAAFTEALRLYPPIWSIGRRAVEEDVFPGGARVRPGDHVVVPVFLIHRDPRFHPAPDLFRPERFIEDGPPKTPGAYIPFGAGHRACVGESFAVMEALPVIAAVSRRFLLEPTGPMPSPELLISLRPKDPGALRPVRRTGL